MGIKPGKEFRFFVVAENKIGAGPASSVAAFRASAAAPKFAIDL